MRALVLFVILIFLTAASAVVQIDAPLWALAFVPLLFLIAQAWAAALWQGDGADSARAQLGIARLLINSYANAQFMFVGAAWLIVPMFWLRHGGNMLAALLLSSALCAWILLYQRRWAFPLWVYFQPTQGRRFAAIARELEQSFWQLESGSLTAQRQFWSRGVWANSIDAALFLMPFALLCIPGFEPHRLRSWLAFCVLILPALALARVQLSVADAAEPRPLATGDSRYQHLIAEFDALDAAEEQRVSESALINDLGGFSALDEATDPEISGVQLLQRAVAKGDLAAVDGLLKSGANPNDLMPTRAADQRSPLVVAAISGQLGMIKRLIAGGADVNGKSGDLTPLLAATRDTWSGRFDVVMALLTNGADVHAKDRLGVTALHGAALCSDTALLQLLLDSGADIASVDANGNTPLACAAAHGQGANVLALLKAGAASEPEGALSLAHALAMCDAPETSLIDVVIARAKLEAQDELGETPLHRCARLDAADFAEALIAASVSINARNSEDQTPMMLAARSGSLRVQQRLSFAKTQADLFDKSGNTALHHAVMAEQARVEMIDLLLSMGAKTQVKNSAGLTPAELALRSGRWDLARRLSPEQELPEELEQTIDDASSLAGVPRREQLLIQAARAQRYPVASSLLKVGPVDQHTHLQILLALGDQLDAHWLADLRAAGLQLGSAEIEPKLCALARQCPPPEAAIELLLEAGASVAADSELDTPLILLCGAAAELEGTSCAPIQSPSPKLLGALLKRGCNLGAKDREHRNALSYAVQWCDLTTVELLLQAGTEQALDLNSRDAAGLTPLLRALSRAESGELVKLLIKQGADPNVTGRDGRSARALALSAAQMGLAEVLAWPKDAHPGRALRDADVAEAAARGDQQGVLRLLQLGFPIDAPDASGFSALTHACGSGNHELIEFLIENGASVAGTEQVVTPLAAAVRGRHFEIVRRLVALGAQINRPIGELTHLSLAAGLLDMECCALLIELGANLTPTEPLLPPVHAAMRAVLAGGDLALGQKLLQFLIQRGADPDAIDSSGRTPLLVLVGANLNVLRFPEDERLLSLLRLMLRLGANPQVRDFHQRGTLHWCCRHVMFAAAEILLDAGADPMAVDEFRKLPVDMTTTLNRHDFLALFRGEGR